VIGAMDRIRAPFNTSIPGQTACAAALFDEDFQRRSVELVEEWRPRLEQQIGGMGFEIYPSHCNFVLVRFPDAPGRSAAEVEAHLASRGVLVRGLANYGLPDFCGSPSGRGAEPAVPDRAGAASRLSSRAGAPDGWSAGTNTRARALAGLLALTAKVCFTASSRISPDKGGHTRDPACSQTSAQGANRSAGGR
jgi:hypothetical protein